MGLLASIGRCVFSTAIIAFGIETLACSHSDGHSLGAQYNVLPVIPWLPANPWIAYLFGAIWIGCGAGILFERSRRIAALLFGVLLLLCALILEVPKNAVNIASVGLRTVVFEPIAIACLAWLMLGNKALPSWLARASGWLLAVALIIFGVDHFISLAFIATLIPAWIPWHVFWVVFFGVAFVAAGLSIGLQILESAGAAGLGLMFAIWVFTLHLPRVLGIYGIPGAPGNPNEWSSLFIAVALWGGLWALVNASKNAAK